MKRRYGLLALALLALLLLNLGAQEEPARPASTSPPPSGAAAPVQAKKTLLKDIRRSAYVYRVDCGGCNACEIEIFATI
ncbi:hypothetical protein ACTFBY_21485, partial [Aeromonas dhakensis]